MFAVCGRLEIFSLEIAFVVGWKCVAPHIVVFNLCSLMISKYCKIRYFLSYKQTFLLLLVFVFSVFK